jgi:peptidoglycan/xylan/chitin deacetylase (PgdA/CDA1 family)
VSGRPTFVLSIDTELVWGSFDHVPPADFAARYPDERGVIREILGLLDRHDVAATWAVVGHLFLADCRRAEDGRAHPDMPRPDYAWFSGDWYRADPCSDRAAEPLWYGDDIVDAIVAAKAGHEIGSHGYSHAVFGDPGFDDGAAVAELDECRRLAGLRRLELRSFVFPRNREGHHALIAEAGFVAVRGADPTWHRRLPGRLGRLAHLVDQALAIAPPVSIPRQVRPGLWDIPGSMVLMERTGVRRLVPVSARVRKARRGLRRAVREGAVFHLWFHPFNLAPDRRAMLGALDQILAEVAALRAAGRLDVRTMAQLAGELQATP